MNILQRRHYKRSEESSPLNKSSICMAKKIPRSARDDKLCVIISIPQLLNSQVGHQTCTYLKCRFLHIKSWCMYG
jgi:hypothetical protein